MKQIREDIMKTYSVTAHYPYEGSTTIAIFTDPEIAELMVKQLEADDEFRSMIYEVEINDADIYVDALRAGKRIYNAILDMESNITLNGNPLIIVDKMPLTYIKKVGSISKTKSKLCTIVLATDEEDARDVARVIFNNQRNPSLESLT
jgi:hypothetical protein